jgi:MFS family permease
MFNAARLVGPAAAGILIGVSGEGICFLIDGLSFLAVIASLLLMKLPPAPAAGQKEPMLHRLAEGFRYAFGFAPIRTILLLLGLTSLMGMQYTVLLPVIARDVLHSGPDGLGFLSAASGVGALAGALTLAARKSVLGLGRVIAWSGACFGAGLVAFSFSRTLGPSLVLMLVIGAGLMVQMAASNTVLQTIVDDEKRGRVMSFYTMTFVGMAPFGSLLAGALAERIEAPATIRVGGLCCLAASLLFARALPDLRKRVRPIYVRRGILPEVAAGLETAVRLTEPGDGA